MQEDLFGGSVQLRGGLLICHFGLALLRKEATLNVSQVRALILKWLCQQFWQVSDQPYGKLLLLCLLPGDSFPNLLTSFGVCVCRIAAYYWQKR